MTQNLLDHSSYLILLNFYQIGRSDLHEHPRRPNPIHDQLLLLPVVDEGTEHGIELPLERLYEEVIELLS